MKKVFVILLLFCSFSVFSQKMPSDYFDEASKYFEKENLDKALEGYQYIVDNNEIRIKAVFHTARNPQIWEQRIS
jgi:hypothetical protein